MAKAYSIIHTIRPKDKIPPSSFSLSAGDSIPSCEQLFLELVLTPNSLLIDVSNHALEL